MKKIIIRGLILSLVMSGIAIIGIIAPLELPFIIIVGLLVMILAVLATILHNQNSGDE